MRTSFGFSRQVDVQLQTASFDVRTGEDAFAFPVHDRPPRCRFGRAAALHEVLEAVEQLDRGGVLPVEIRVDAVELGHAAAAITWNSGRERRPSSA